MMRTLRSPLLAVVAGLSVACGAADQSTTPLSVDPGAALRAAPGAVAVASNSAAGNSVLVFGRGIDGSLQSPVAYATGGAGTGAGLGNQGGLALAGDRRYLFAVNAGSDELSIFAVSGSELRLVDREPSGGQQPISVTEHAGVVYVLNAGGDGNIAGFRQHADGTLTPIAGALRPLSGAGVNPAEVSFSPDGRLLAVTEKGTNLITLYDVNAAGVAGAPRPQPSAGATPFGFAFSPRGTLVVSEAFGGAPDASAVSSYAISRSGALQVRSASVPTTETAACWVAITPNGRYAYATNTGSASVSGYKIGPDGELDLLVASGVSGATGTTPIDLAITPDGRRLYTLDSSAHQLSAFAVLPDGSLEAGAPTTGLPVGASGVVAW
jgi:6-phosphogluconolactonase